MVSGGDQRSETPGWLPYSNTLHVKAGKEGTYKFNAVPLVLPCRLIKLSS